jgi:hypothetical protein
MVAPLVIAGGIAAASALASAFGAAKAAKAQQKAVEAQADAQIKMLDAETSAGLESLQADTKAQVSVITSDANAQIKAKQYEAVTEGQNVQISRILGQDALTRGTLDEYSYRRDASQGQGQARAFLAGTGVELSSGSAAWLQEEQIVATDLDALAIRQNAAREKYGFDFEAYAASRRQGLAEMEGASTAEVANANIVGLRNVAKIKAKGIRSTAKANREAIKDAAKKGGSVSPGASAAVSVLGAASNFASMWYMSQGSTSSGATG